ncbi:uncharacterized protein SPPG_07595 [Spizellomyces punctatus DAOM BR117]|uniref:Response regulatory domain-containing protein n=1 Tax=Spizellomyces punctatus (strain DAOM BR117) TaxID=645134 RepID=A0A0L0H973_SPIPD|nr:uncharacterized protein SPPG_07595 [Spizellomyces punctatus DAOM BR117]KNC97208.1 hypothetical protein SPPG_07595 [Spizellomyces punctatus DAOM BR117]|eukprot:XP_016605248.1 hypothetical protein SPPG_07595 [Spizellomyces punctatus DAOM BR117]
MPEHVVFDAKSSIVDKIFPLVEQLYRILANASGKSPTPPPDASDGIEAVELFKKQRLNIIFVDIDMPYKNGVEVTREIRQYERDHNLDQTPIIGVSGFTERQYEEQAFAAGMNKFVSKGTGYQLKDIYRIVVEYCGDPKT